VRDDSPPCPDSAELVADADTHAALKDIRVLNECYEHVRHAAEKDQAAEFCPDGYLTLSDGETSWLAGLDVEDGESFAYYNAQYVHKAIRAASILETPALTWATEWPMVAISESDGLRVESMASPRISQEPEEPYYETAQSPVVLS